MIRGNITNKYLSQNGINQYASSSLFIRLGQLSIHTAKRYNREVTKQKIPIANKI